MKIATKKVYSFRVEDLNLKIKILVVCMNSKKNN